MKQLMVISHDTYAQGLTIATDDIDQIASLAVGAYAIIDRDPDSATVNMVADLAAVSEAATPAKFQFVTMTANGLKWSPVIEKARCKVNTQADIVPVAQVTSISVTIAAPEVLQVAGFVVTDLDKNVADQSRNRFYEYSVVTGDTEATIVAALIAKVQADANRIVNAASGTDIALTAITAGKPFAVSMLGIFRGATITNDTACVRGTGTGAQLLLLEQECEILQGDHNTPQYNNLAFPKASEVVAASTYDCYILRYTNPTQRGIITGENPEQELVVALLGTLTAVGTADKSREAMGNFLTDFA